MVAAATAEPLQLDLRQHGMKPAEAAPPGTTRTAEAPEQ